MIPTGGRPSRRPQIRRRWSAPASILKPQRLRGVVVSPQLDLVDVAYCMSCDDKASVETWMGAGLVGQVSDAQAQEWLEANALVWSVVVRPWVLVQPVLRDPNKSHQVELQ